MRLATLRAGGSVLVGAVDSAGERYAPLADMFPNAPAAVASDMAAAIAWLAGRVASPPPELAWRPLTATRLAAPLPAPPHNVMCVGKNYREHASEFANSGFDSSRPPSSGDIPEHPIVFTKPSTSIAGPYDDILLAPGLDAAVDYESELAVVIGRGGRFIEASKAYEHVFGYTIVNDVTARDLQKRHAQWFLGKGADSFCPMGPWIVTSDAFDLAAARVSCRVNGELRQDAPVTDLIFDIPALIETISRSVTLAPGDVIATGTPAGVGIGSNPPRFLHDGDVVECTISGIGSIRNTCRAVKRP
jgi:2-keto-4-pentenoate hydratase/2-oxohepta-3-ene-1,7-dioic acid hydratase in catechol pathway